MPATIQIIFFDLGDTLVGTATREFLPGAKRMLAQLEARGVRLGIISNTGNLTRAQLAAELPLDFDWARFDQELIVLSSEVGVEKPDPAIFAKAVSKAGIAASLCLYCSEDLLETLVAQQVGLRAARLQQPPQSDASELVPSLAKAGLLV